MEKMVRFHPVNKIVLRMGNLIQKNARYVARLKFWVFITVESAIDVFTRWIIIAHGRIIV